MERNTNINIMNKKQHERTSRTNRGKINHNLSFFHSPVRPFSGPTFNQRRKCGDETATRAETNQVLLHCMIMSFGSLSRRGDVTINRRIDERASETSFNSRGDWLTHLVRLSIVRFVCLQHVIFGSNRTTKKESEREEEKVIKSFCRWLMFGPEFERVHTTRSSNWCLNQN